MSLSDKFRQKASDQSAASLQMFEAEDFERSAKKQALAVIGQVNATLLDGLADVVDHLTLLAASGGGQANEKRLTILRTNDAIRRAAAKGDWSEFDRLSAELAGIVGGATAGGGAAGGDASG